MVAEIIQLIFQHSESHPGNIAIEDSEQRLPYGKLKIAVSRLKEVLLDKGVRLGDKVPILTTRCKETSIALKLSLMLLCT
jgi:non-ribosomal peptide synthetase component E (peptide arylation enzyme)